MINHIQDFDLKLHSDVNHTFNTTKTTTNAKGQAMTAMRTDGLWLRGCVVVDSSSTVSYPHAKPGNHEHNRISNDDHQNDENDVQQLECLRMPQMRLRNRHINGTLAQAGRSELQGVQASRNAAPPGFVRSIVSKGVQSD